MNKLTRSLNSLSSSYYTLVSNKYQADLLNCYWWSYKTVSSLLLDAGIKNYFIPIIKVMEIHEYSRTNWVINIAIALLQLIYCNQ